MEHQFALFAGDAQRASPSRSWPTAARQEVEERLAALLLTAVLAHHRPSHPEERIDDKPEDPSSPPPA